MRYLVALMLGCVCTSLLAELTVDVRAATTVVTSTTTDATQITTEDGDEIGDEVVNVRDPVVSKGQPVAVMILKSPIGFEALKVKSKCDTADVIKVLPNVFFVGKPGTHVVRFDTLSIEPFSWDDVTVTVMVGDAPPLPDDPDPPLPPLPDGLPIDGTGLRVLIVYETSDLATMPREQNAILFSAELRSLLTANCVNVGGTPEWRILDQNTQFTDAAGKWAKAIAKPRASIPWIAISNGVTGYAGPLPENESKTIELVKKYIPKAKVQAKVELPILEVYTLDGCMPCEEWKRTVAPTLAGEFEIRYNSRSAAVSQYPAFMVVDRGVRGLLFTGSTSGSTLRSELHRLRDGK